MAWIFEGWATRIVLTSPESAALAHWRRDNKDGIVRRKRGWTIAAMIGEYKTFLDLAKRWALEHTSAKEQHGEDERMLGELYWMIEDEKAKLMKALQGDCPIGFFRASYEQAHVLNSWHPEYEPEEAPGGYQIVCNFGGKRSLKTCATVINNLLWIIPNDPNWVIFEPYVDKWGRKVQVFPRFNWDEWKRSGRRVMVSDEPPKDECEIWHGCVDDQHWKEKIFKEYGKWMPDKFIARRGKDREWYVTDKWFRAKHGSSVYAKLYGSDQQAWSGKELWMITLDEGPPRDKLDEAIFRTRYLHWSFTPGDPANIGEKSALAREVFDGDYKLPFKAKFLFPKTKYTPDFAIDGELIAQRVALAEQRGEQGRVEVEGGFFDSSPRIFTHFKPDMNIIPVDGETIVRAIRSELSDRELKRFPWLVKFKDANIGRGFDEGLLHPTACAWQALLQTGERVFFRELEESDASIGERCERVVTMSGNKLLELRTSGMLSEQDRALALLLGPDILGDRVRAKVTGTRVPRFVEKFVREPIRRTKGDSKLFKRDPTHPMDNWSENYARGGLKLERALSIGPAERGDFVNGLFRVDQTRRHLNPEQGGEDGFGCGLYLTNDLVIMRKRIERYLRAQYLTGPLKGGFTGKPQATGDDLIDALCYIAIEKMTWIDPSKYAMQTWHRDRVVERRGQVPSLQVP